MAHIFQFHTHLNPKLWRDQMLIPMVRLKLFRTALEFYKFIDVPRLIVSDIILTGSNAAFNYTDHSDVDVHLIVDFSQSVCPQLAANFFSTKKSLWSETYDVTIHHLPVELYVEDAAEPVKANGVFSILHNQWLKEPSPVKPTPDDNAVRQKTQHLRHVIDHLLHEPSVPEIDRLFQKLKAMRRAGLEHGGEFSVDNLSYKVLRDTGYLQNLYAKRIELKDQELSL